mgnify:FL=1
MGMDKVDARSILESMATIQRNAGYTISKILDEALFALTGMDGKELWHLHFSPRLGHSVWDCEESPVMLCIYDSNRDRAMDQCVFCGLPDQRK